MNIYLPIAEMSVNIPLIMLLGLFTGILAGLFGIGGGFIATPLLMFIGIPPAIAVSTSANQIISSSVSGVLAHLKKGNVDIKMGGFLVLGGFIGSTIGVSIFTILQQKGKLDLVISILYILVLGSISIIMLIDNFKSICEKKYNLTFGKKSNLRFKKFLVKIDKLPLKIYFPKSQISASIIVFLILSSGIGIMVILMGVGGGFMMIPAMIYILRMPPHLVIGTSLFQIIFIAVNATFLQAATNNTIDIVLSILMISSSALGAQIGARIGYKIDADKLRSGLALIIFLVCLKIFFTLLISPEQLFIIENLH